MLLLDENLSPRLIARIESCYPESLHVIHAGLDNSPDIQLWLFAKSNNLTIISKDKDFISMLKQLGHPPKLIHLTTGNVKVAVVDRVLVENKTVIYDFLKDSAKGELEL